MQASQATYCFERDRLGAIKDQVLEWASATSGTFLFLDSNDWPEQNHARYELLVAVGERRGRSVAMVSAMAVQPENGSGSEVEEGRWLFGHLGYGLRTALEPSLQDDLPALDGFPDCYFFEPEVVVLIVKGRCELVVESPEQHAIAILQSIQQTQVTGVPLPHTSFQQSFSPKEYQEVIGTLLQHIRRGDCYELNFCAAATAAVTLERPQDVYRQLTKLSPAPMAACYRQGRDWLLCASPERYLHKSGNTLRTMPIKGTIRRGSDGAEDAALGALLLTDPKERAEHTMVVDLARNDLARCCVPGTIRVEAFMDVQKFPKVQHLVSTVAGELRQEVSLTNAIHATFPMASMTGMPKVKVMELIGQYERHRRGLFSGSVGYVDPEGNADFNVVIRSLFYNAARRLISYQTGGAITLDSTPEQEWQERMLKAAGMEAVFRC